MNYNSTICEYQITVVELFTLDHHNVFDCAFRGNYPDLRIVETFRYVILTILTIYFKYKVKTTTTTTKTRNI